MYPSYVSPHPVAPSNVPIFLAAQPPPTPALAEWSVQNSNSLISHLPVRSATLIEILTPNWFLHFSDIDLFKPEKMQKYGFFTRHTSFGIRASPSGFRDSHMKAGGGGGRTTPTLLA